MLVEVILFSLCVIIFFYYRFQNSYQYFIKRNITQAEPIQFPYGNWKDNILGKKSLGIIVGDFYKKYKNSPAIGVFQMNDPNLIINDPELIKQILIGDFNSFVNRGFIINEQIDPLAGHLFFLDGQKWRNLRNKLSPTFTSGKIKQMFHIIDKRSKYLIKYLEKFDGEEIEAKEVLARLLTDIISECAFGIESNCIENPNSEFREMGKKSFQVTFRAIVVFWLTIVATPIRNFLKIKTLDPNMQDFFINIVAETIKYREKNNIKINDFMQMLIQLKNNQKITDDESKDTVIKDDGTALTIEQCAAQAFVFFLAGFETSSNTMSNALYELAKNPDIQQKLQKEIDQVFAKHNELTYDSMSELHYLDNVIHETLRKYPPVQIINRQVTKPIEIKCGNNKSMVRLDKDLKLIIPAYGLHHDPQYFPDPERFDPDRFTEENVSKRPKYVYLPFGDGPRNCIGARFGFLQTKLGLALLLRNYNFLMSENTPLKFTYNAYSFVLASNEVLKLKIEKRILTK